MSNPAFWTAIPQSDSDSSDGDEDWSLPPPDPVKEAEIRAALEAANALKLKKQEEEMKTTFLNSPKILKVFKSLLIRLQILMPWDHL